MSVREAYEKSRRGVEEKEKLSNMLSIKMKSKSGFPRLHRMYYVSR